MPAKKRSAAKKTSRRALPQKKSGKMSPVMQFAVVFIFVAAIVLVAYVVKNFM